jgi:hypothetical protein
MERMYKDNRRCRVRRLNRDHFGRLLEAAVLDDNMGAGLQISGTSGSGKSNIAEWLAVRMHARGLPFVYFDPHGNSARKILRMCLDLPPSQRRRVLYVCFTDPEHIACINPLAVPQLGQSAYVHESQLRVRVEHTAQVIFSLFGEGAVGFANRTLLRKWLTRWLTTLARSQLTLADALLLADPKQPIYEQLLRLVPDDLARQQMASLMTLKTSELEAEIGSARNRIMGVLDHPVSQTVFSGRENVLDFRSIYAAGLSVIFDFDKGDLLTDDVQQLIANLALNQYLAAVLATPEHQRRRRLCFVDELAVFSSSAPLLQAMCTEIRKFKTKFAFLHQGSARFPDRHENEFLNTITDMCRVQLFFRHAAADAQFFGKQISLATWGQPKVKHVQRVPQQFTVGHDLVELTDTSQGTSDGDTTGTSEASASGTQEGTSSQLTDTLGTAVSRAERATTDSSSSSKATGEGRQSSTSSTQTRTTNDSRTITHSQSQTTKQQLVPRIITKDIITSVQFFTPEEIDRDHAGAIVQFGTGEAYLLIGGLGTFLGQAPLAVDVLARTPQYAARRLTEFFAEQWQRPEFVAPAAVVAQRQAFLAQLLTELTTMRLDEHMPQQPPLHAPPSLPLTQTIHDAPWRI